MAFPSSPVNGQTATVDNITYTYASATNSWKRQAFLVSNLVDTSATANTVYTQGVDVTQNTRMSVIEGGLISANANTVFLNSLITTNNTRISSTDNTATAAYAKANAAFDKANTGGSGSSSGYLANSVIIANTTGYLTNTSSIQFFTSNNNLVLTGNVIGGGVRSTTSSSAPTSPTVGDIWYETTTDIIYRFTNDGSGNYWLDVTSPTVSSNASSSSATAGPAFAGYASNPVTLVQNVSTKIPINVEEFDTNNCFDSTTNYRFTPTVAGYYHIGGSIEAVGSAYLRAMIFKNGSLFKYSGNSATGNAPYNQNVSALIYLNGTTDYVEFYGFQGLSSVNTSNSDGASVTNYFYGFMVRGV